MATNNPPLNISDKIKEKANKIKERAKAIAAAGSSGDMLRGHPDPGSATATAKADLKLQRARRARKEAQPGKTGPLKYWGPGKPNNKPKVERHIVLKAKPKPHDMDILNSP